MALKITYIKQAAPEPKVVASERLWKTADGKRLVPEGHLEARILFCAAGHEVSRAEFESMELVGFDEGPVAVEEAEAAPVPFPGDGQPEADAEAEPEAEEEEKPKRRRRGADKAVKGPDGDK